MRTTTAPIPRRVLRRVLAVVAALAMAMTGLVATSPTARADVPAGKAPLLQRDNSVVTADALPTIQINDGYVWAQTMIGNTVYAAGNFTNALGSGASPGSDLTARTNILAYNITTGALTSFAPTVNGVIRSIVASPDGSRIYIGGSFNNVNGQARWNIAALDATTGALVPGWSPSIGGSGVYALTISGSSVYAGGLFTQGNGVGRRNLAAFATSNGALQPWAPTTDLQVDAMVTEPDTGQIVIGGRFYAVNNQVQRGLANLHPSTGAINTSWQAPHTVVNGMSSGGGAGKAGIFGLATDDSGVYGTGWVFANASVGNLEGVFAADKGSGAIRWVADCHGDHYGVHSTGQTVYATSHTHECETVNLAPEQSPRAFQYAEAFTTEARGTLSRSASAGSTYKDWSGTPSPSAYAWSPDFTVGTTSGLGQAGLSITGTGSHISVAGEFTSVNGRQFRGLVRFGTSPSGGAKEGPRIPSASWTPTASSTTPGMADVSVPGNWDRDDRDLTYELRRSGTSTPVATTKSASTWWKRPAVSLRDTTATPGSSQTYTVVVKDGDNNTVTSRPVTVNVAAGDRPGTYSSTVLGDGASLYWPLGSSTSDMGGSNPPVRGSGVSTVTSGTIPGAETGASALTGTSNGRISATRSWPTAPDTFSAELWFRTDSTRGGKLIGLGSSQAGSSSSYDRHVYMANDGRLSFGVYPGEARAITSTGSFNDNQWHHAVATLGTNGMQLFVDGDKVASDASTTNGQAYQGYWRVGGDSIGGWPNAPSSAYLEGSVDEVAIYPSVLTTQQITRHRAVGLDDEPPEEPADPVADFTSDADGLKVTFDASATTVGSGQSVASHAWTFGDGATSTTGPTVSHTYGGAGTYTVSLTVKDNDGRSSTKSRSVTVAAAPSDQLARDDFGRTVASGWGTADEGGAWSATVGSQSAGSVSAGKGNLGLGAGSTRTFSLKSVSARDTSGVTQFSLNSAPSTGNTYVGVLARQSDSHSYRIRAWMRTNGTVWLTTERDGTVLEAQAVPGLTWSEGDSLKLRAEVSGTSPTTIRARVWKASDSEPSGWHVSATDSTTALAQPGWAGLHGARSGSATSSSTVTFDDYRVTDLE